ncbi:MAG: 3-hydroxyacyl-ACP dehydratase FabZ [Nitrospinae bacterium]|nr:3-hydroxyacyl-ACP dehydratase FabZ [Nitrospinota bacterium]
MDINDIIETLPHRYPFLLLDGILAIEEHKSVKAIKNVSFNEAFFQGHFPGKPIMPGVLIIEAMAQAAAYLAIKSAKNLPGKKIPLFTGIENARFKRPVVPGDVLTLDLTVNRTRSRIWWLTGTATVGGELACKADITAMLSVEEPGGGSAA